MNLIDLIKEQFSSDVTSRLSSLVGGTESQTKSALGAAVPALLSAFSGMASAGGSGAEKLASAINSAETKSFGSMDDILRGNPEQAAQQGGGLLGSLLGGGTLSALAGAVSKFVNMDSAILKRLLAYVSPMVLGLIAKQFHGKPATAQGLTSFFDQQKENIADAMPAGLSLANVPGIPDIGPAARGVASATHRTAGAARDIGTSVAHKTAGATRDTGPSILKTVLPIAAVALLGFLGWQFFKNRTDNTPVRDSETTVVQHTVNKPAVDLADSVPDVTKVSNDLTSVFNTATQTLSTVTDAASAEAALPKLNELNAKIDGLGAARDKFPASVRSSIAKIATDNFGKLREQIEKVLAIPTVKEKLGPVLNGMLTKLKAFENNT